MKSLADRSLADKSYYLPTCINNKATSVKCAHQCMHPPFIVIFVLLLVHGHIAVPSPERQDMVQEVLPFPVQHYGTHCHCNRSLRLVGPVRMLQFGFWTCLLWTNKVMMMMMNSSQTITDAKFCMHLNNVLFSRAYGTLV